LNQREKGWWVVQKDRVCMIRVIGRKKKKEFAQKTEIGRTKVGRPKK